MSNLQPGIRSCIPIASSRAEPRLDVQPVIRLEPVAVAPGEVAVCEVTPGEVAVGDPVPEGEHLVPHHR